MEVAKSEAYQASRGMTKVMSLLRTMKLKSKVSSVSISIFSYLFLIRTYPIFVDIVLELTSPTGKYRAQAQIGDMPMLDVGIDVKVDGIEFTTAATTTAIQNLKIWPTPPIQIEDIEVSNIF